MGVDWREHVVCDPDILGGKPTLKGTRLSIKFVLDLLAGGWHREAIRQNYPNLTEERIRAVRAYAAERFREDRFHRLSRVERARRTDFFSPLGTRGRQNRI